MRPLNADAGIDIGGYFVQPPETPFRVSVVHLVPHLSQTRFVPSICILHEWHGSQTRIAALSSPEAVLYTSNGIAEPPL